MLLAAAGLALASCRGNRSDQPPVHLQQNMDFQNRGEAQEHNPLFADGRWMRPKVEGTVAVGFLKEDAENLAADGLHDLMRCWEAYHRMHQAEAHVRSILFREETRWPGYYFRADKPSIDQANWLAFCNCKYDKNTGEWEMIKRPVKYLTQ